MEPPTIGTIIGAGIGIAIGLAILIALVVAGGRLSGLQLNVVGTVASSLAAATANAAVYFIAKGQFGAALAGMFNPGVAETFCTLLGYLISLAVLAVCLFAFASMPLGPAWTLSMFANGGAVVGSGLLLMIGGTGLAMPTLPAASLILVCVGLILLVAGYLLGSSNRLAAPEPGYDSQYSQNQEVIMPNDNSPYRRTIAPVPVAPDAVQTTKHEPTVKHEPTAKRVTVLATDKTQPGSGAWLVITIGRGKGTKFDLSSGDSKIGAAGDCQIRVTGDEEISGQHCLIRQGDGRYELHDLASRNGTYLNGSRIRDARSLQDGDRITLGQTQLTFKKV